MTFQNPFGGIHITDNPHDLRGALAEAGLDWKAEKRPVFLQDGTHVPDAYAVVRDDNHTVLGTVGNRYRLVQNAEAFGVFQTAFDAGLLEVALAGSLYGGATVWVQARVRGEALQVVGDDRLMPYVLLANSHDGSICLRAGFTAVRLFCMNQMAAAQREGALVKLRHTAHVDLRQLEAGIMAGQKHLGTVTACARLLASKQIPNADTLALYTRRSLGLNEEKPSRVEAPVAELFEQGIGNDYRPIRGTWWAAYNAVTEYLTHHRGKSQDARVTSLWFGESSRTVGRALSAALEMAS